MENIWMNIGTEVSWMVSGLLGVINGLLFYQLKKFGDRLDYLEKEVVAVKLNYINRFELATADRVSMNADLLKAINDVIISNEKTHNSIMRQLNVV